MIVPPGPSLTLDHVTLRTSDLDGTRAFFEDVLGLTPGYRPPFSFPGYWLHAGIDPVVHLSPGGGGHVDRDGETIDHIGFRLSGYDVYRARLDELKLKYSLMELAELKERRIFVRTSTGILLELVFRGEPSSTKYPAVS
jgi:catechol 2,3-dioxygenase-like lactoylglutathione lyase family enzyme